MKGFRNTGGAQRFPSIRFRPRRHLMPASGCRVEMTIRSAYSDVPSNRCSRPSTSTYSRRPSVRRPRVRSRRTSRAAPARPHAGAEWYCDGARPTSAPARRATRMRRGRRRSASLWPPTGRGARRCAKPVGADRHLGHKRGAGRPGSRARHGRAGPVGARGRTRAQQGSLRPRTVQHSGRSASGAVRARRSRASRSPRPSPVRSRQPGCVRRAAESAGSACPGRARSHIRAAVRA